MTELLRENVLTKGYSVSPPALPGRTAWQLVLVRRLVPGLGLLLLCLHTLAELIDAPSARWRSVHP